MRPSGGYWREGGSELEMDRLVHVRTAGTMIETEIGTGGGLKAMGGAGVACFGPWAKSFKPSLPRISTAGGKEVSSRAKQTRGWAREDWQSFLRIAHQPEA